MKRTVKVDGITVAVDASSDANVTIKVGNTTVTENAKVDDTADDTKFQGCAAWVGAIVAVGAVVAVVQWALGLMIGGW